MDKETLIDYHKKEEEKSSKLFNGIRNKKNFDLREFYPELELVFPYGAYYPVNPLLNVLPFYNKLIVL